MYSYNEIANKLRNALLQSKLLDFIPDNSIVVLQTSDESISIPSFDRFLIVIRPPDSGFITIVPKINQIIRYIYTLSIEIYEKRSADEILNYEISKYDVLNNVIETLEHNTLNNSIVTHPNLVVSDIGVINTDSENVEGIGFVWQGYKDVIKYKES